MGVKLKEYKEWRNNNLSLFFNSLKTHFVFGFFYLAFFGVYAQEAPSWVDFCSKKEIGDTKNSVLLDYSYAGYHFSEKPLPDTSSWNTISVIDYGATPNDDNYDDAGIQAAIDAAGETGLPTVVYFPAGKYIVSSKETKNLPIEINKSHIVLKGAGSGNEGTEIYAVNFGDTSKKWNTPWRFRFAPSKSSSSTLTSIKRAIRRGDKTIEVADVSKIQLGMLLSINHEGIDNLEINFPELPLNSDWTRIKNEGVKIIEKHLVTNIEGNKVTFKNPINYNIPLNGDFINLKEYSPIEEVGVEDILFTSGWKHYPENFVHHANDIVDYAWRAIYFEKVYNSWIQNVKFQDWNDCIQINDGFAITVKDVVVSGKQGHASYMADGCTGVLFENCKDNVPFGYKNTGGQGHGPALQGYSTGCVYKNIQMQRNQSIDCHGYAPYGNLLDNVFGGTLKSNGGSLKAYPNSGPDLVFWNFSHAMNDSSYHYNFWEINKRLLHTFIKPKFIGFTSPGENITFKNEGLDEMHGTQVYPQSLFDAQLQLRLFNVYASASSQKEGCEAINIVNLDENDYWSPKTNYAVESFLTLDFGKIKSVTGILLKEVSKGINNITIECWVDGDWKKVKSTKSIHKKDYWKFNKEIITRKLKLIIKEVNENDEIKVYKLEAI